MKSYAHYTQKRDHGRFVRLAATAGFLTIGLIIFGIGSAHAAKSGFVANTSGGQNFVDVSDSGQITITPVKKSDGQYTTDLNSGALKNFLMTESVFSCLVPPPPPPGGGGGGNNGGGGGWVDTDGDGNGDTWGDSNQCNNSGGCSQWQGTETVNGLDNGDHNGSVGSGTSGGGGGSSGSSRIMCTHFYRRGRLGRDLWRDDLEFTFANMSRTTIRGYQAWGIPYVRLMRKSKLAEAIMWPIVYHRAQEISYQMGHRDRPDYLGKFIRSWIEPLCFVIGWFVPEQNWKSLYQEGEIEAIEGQR